MRCWHILWHLSMDKTEDIQEKFSCCELPADEFNHQCYRFKNIYLQSVVHCPHYQSFLYPRRILLMGLIFRIFRTAIITGLSLLSFGQKKHLLNVPYMTCWHGRLCVPGQKKRTSLNMARKKWPLKNKWTRKPMKSYADYQLKEENIDLTVGDILKYVDLHSSYLCVREGAWIY